METTIKLPKKGTGTLINSGGSLAVIIPKKIVTMLGLRPGDIIVKSFDLETLKLTIQFKRPKFNSLKYLGADISSLVKMELEEGK